MRHRVRQKAILALLDGRLSRGDRASLERHIEECDECSRYLDGVVAARETMRGIASSSPPPVDWQRIEAGIAAGREARPHRTFGALAMWGTLAATSAAAFLVTWALSSSPVDDAAPPSAPIADETPTKGGDPVDSAEEPHRAAPRLVEAYVTYVAGEAGHVDPGTSDWLDLGLEAPIEVGTRLRTGEHGGAGIQLGPEHACRIGPGSEVRVVDLGSHDVRLEVDAGDVVCSSSAAEGEGPALTVAVMDVVASASGQAHFAVRRAPRVVVVELAEGTLHVSPDEVGGELVEPGRLTISRDDDDRLAAERSAESSPELPAVPISARRSIASLEIPQIASIERVTVDGIEFEALPLHLRRRPGPARVELFAEGRPPIVQHIQIGLGPRVVEIDLPALEPSMGPTLSQRVRERRVSPKIGTYRPDQIRRLRGLVGRRVRGCYERALKRNPSIWGRIRVRFTVSTSGEARRVHVSNLAGGHADVNRCIESSLGSDRFPPPVGGHVPVEQTITLSPQF